MLRHPGKQFSTMELSTALEVRGANLSMLLRTAAIHGAILVEKLGPRKSLWSLPDYSAPPPIATPEGDIPQRRADDFSRAIQRQYRPKALLVVQLRDMMWQGGKAPTGNPQLALGLALDAARQVLERRHAPGRFVTAEVEIAVANELAAIERACALATANLNEFLAGLDT